MFGNITHVLAKAFTLVALTFLSSCARHSSQGGSVSPNIAYQVSFSVSGASMLSEVPARTPVCVVVERVDQSPTGEVDLSIVPPAGVGFALRTDSSGVGCFLPHESGHYSVTVLGPGGVSAPTMLEVLPYTVEVVMTSDVWRNGSTIWLGLVSVTNGAPTNNLLSNTRFIIRSSSGASLMVLEAGISGRVSFENHLVQGRYEVFASVLGTADLSPVREAVSLAPTEDAIGISLGQQLDGQGNWLPEQTWWDGQVGVSKSFRFIVNLAQSAHLGGQARIDGADSRVFVLTQGVEVFQWEAPPPEHSGLYLGSGYLDLPTTVGLIRSNALSRTILVL